MAWSKTCLGRGVRIPVESVESIKNRYYVREILEVGAVDKMLELEVPNAKTILMEKANKCDEVELTGPESFKVFADKHTDLHLTIATLSGNPLLFRELNRLNFRSMMLSNSKCGWEMQGESLIALHHQDFIHAIFSPNRSEALQAVREHVRRGCAMELATLAKLNQIQEAENCSTTF